MNKAIFVKTGSFYEDYEFVTVLNEKGEKEYFVNGEKTNKEEGNNIYISLKKKNEIKEVVIIDTDMAKKLIEEHMKNYDKYVCYIDDYRQMVSQEELNRKCMNCSKVLAKCFNIEFETHKYI